MTFSQDTYNTKHGKILAFLNMLCIYKQAGLLKTQHRQRDTVILELVTSVRSLTETIAQMQTDGRKRSNLQQ